MNKIPLQLVELLNKKVQKYKTPEFILQDPISIPHQFHQKQDIEIAGFLTAIISWGSRKNILASAQKLMKIMNNKPYYFICNYSPADNKKLTTFYYRTFQPEDTLFFIKSLNRYYSRYNTLEKVFESQSVIDGIDNLRNELLKVNHLNRNKKHLPDVKNGSAAKRINMFLRWMVRKDEVDFGLWNALKPSDLLIPLDIHTARTAYSLGLLNNTQSHLKNVLHLTEILKTIDKNDPIKYDFALFGMSAYEKLNYYFQES